MMCRAMGVSRSGYYDWVDRPASARAQRHRTLTEKIRYFHQTSRDTYGSPRICEDLVRAGEHIGKNIVALLMQRAGIVPKTVRKFRVTTDSRKTVPELTGTGVCRRTPKSALSVGYYIYTDQTGLVISGSDH